MKNETSLRVTEVFISEDDADFGESVMFVALEPVLAELDEASDLLDRALDWVEGDGSSDVAHAHSLVCALIEKLKAAKEGR